MPDLLVILNPRRIVECLEAFEALPIDKLWVTSMTEWEIRQEWSRVLEISADYDRLIIQSDDGIVQAHALAAVQRLLDEGHPVATAYSNLSAVDYRVNLCKNPLREPLGTDSYDLYTLAEVMEYRSPEVPTYLAAMCLTGMSHGMWERFAFTTHSNVPPGNASDYMLSRQLFDADIPIIAAREAFVWHVKEEWNRADSEERKRLYIDQPSELTLSPQ